MILYALLLVLGLIALLHLIWGLGFSFPLRDEALLAKSVVGRPGIRQMPGAIACAGVAMLLVFLMDVLWNWPEGVARSTLLGAAAAVFGARGLATYTEAWRKLVPEQPFARLDRRFYGPLCLGIGAALLSQL